MSAAMPSSISIVSALHAELERARLLVNLVNIEQLTEENEVDYLMKCFLEERTKWKYKERKAVETAMESFVCELEVDKKLRTRLECLNKRLGRELSVTKAALLEAVKELKTKKRVREIIKDICNQLAGNVGHTLKLRDQLEASFNANKAKENGICAQNYSGDENDVNNSSNAHPWRKRGGDGREAEDMIECKDDSAESEVNSVHHGVVGHHKAHDETCPSDEEENKGRSSTSNRGPRKCSTSLKRSASDTVDYGIKFHRSKDDTGNTLDWERFQEQGDRDDMHASNLMKGLRDRMLYYGSGITSPRAFGSPSIQGHRFSSSVLHNAMQERPPLAPGKDGRLRHATAKPNYYSLRKAVR